MHVHCPSHHCNFHHKMVEVLEHCRVGPTPGTVAGTSLPLTFFDLMLFHFAPVDHLFFFDFPHSNSHFSETIIPNLKHSLSIALQHFFPLAGYLIIPTDKSTKPDIRYQEGDSVSLTVAESGKDFDHLAGDHPRPAGEFYDLLPRLQSEVANAIPLIAIQVTLFPRIGVCLGLTYLHKAIDGRTFLNFLQSWASISKFGRLNESSLPSFDRTVIPDPDGRLESIFWSKTKLDTFDQWQIDKKLLISRIRATFLLTDSDLRRLKKSVLTRRPALSHVSTFTTVCAYSWICRVKSGAAMEEEDDDGLEYFGCTADCRGGRTNPPIPPNYFGNCLVVCFTSGKRSELLGEEGIAVAAELIGEAISRRVSEEGEVILEGVEKWLLDVEGVKMERLFTVAGSPRLPVYEVDFGWGKPRKREIVSVDGTGAVSLTKTKKNSEEGGVEIGLSLPIDQMNAFSAIFANGLKATE